MGRGEEVRGVAHSADASASVEITLYDWSGTARTLGAGERLVVTAAFIMSTAAGDCAAYFDNNDDNTLDAGEAFLRGPVAANSGIAMQYTTTPVAGAKGGKPHLLAPAGNADCVLSGYILQT